MRNTHSAGHRARKWAAGLLFALYLMALGMACSEALHQSVHSDAQDPQHQCAATLISSNLIDAAPSHSFEPLRPNAQLLPATFDLAAIPSEERFLLPNRGPPSPVPLSKVAGPSQV